MDDKATARGALQEDAGAVFAPDRATAQPRQDNPAKRYLRRYIGLRKYRDALRDEPGTLFGNICLDNQCRALFDSQRGDG